jgi:hypothetical protein
VSFAFKSEINRVYKYTEFGEKNDGLTESDKPIFRLEPVPKPLQNCVFNTENRNSWDFGMTSNNDAFATYYLFVRLSLI